MKNLFTTVLLLFLLLIVSCANETVDNGGAIEVEVMGTLHMPDGTVAPNTEVVLADSSDADNILSFNTKTDSSGSYFFKLAPSDSGEFSLNALRIVDSVEFTYFEQGIDIIPDTSKLKTLTIDLGIDTLVEQGYIAGTVNLPIKDLSGSGIGILKESYRAISDSSGQFVMINIPVGQAFTLRYSHHGYYDFDTTITVLEHGDTVTIAPVTLKRDPSVPVDPPINLQASYKKETQEVTLHWSPVDDPILTGYRIFRRIKDGDIDVFDTISGKSLITDTSFIDTILPAQQSEITFLYQLKSWDENNNSSTNYSQGVEVTVYPEIPSKPNVPTKPLPGEAFKYAAVGVELPFHFTGGPEKLFDTVTYTILFDTLNPPVDTLFKAQKETDFVHSLSDSARIYYWQVIATNSQGTVEGPVWSIKTEQSLPIFKDMRYIQSKGKTFTMGSAKGKEDDMLTEHPVSFTYDYYMDSTEVSQSYFHARLSINHANVYQKPWWDNKDDTAGNDNFHPAYSISWYDAVLYCNAKSAHYGLDSVYQYDQISGILCAGGTLINLQIDTTANGCRLPTEAEWEYVCKRGGATLYFWGDVFSDEFDHCTWFGTSNGTSSNFHSTIHYLTSDSINGLGGNVSEWCHDIYIQDTYDTVAVQNPWGAKGDASGKHVIRGGNWTMKDTTDLMIHRRYYLEANETKNYIGFRTVIPIVEAWKGN